MRTIHCFRAVVLCLLFSLAGDIGFRSKIHAQSMSSSVEFGITLDATTDEPLSDDDYVLLDSETEAAIGIFIPLKENAIVFFDTSRSMIKIKFEDYIGVIYKKLTIREPNNFLRLNDTYSYAEIDTFGNLLSPYAIEIFGDWALERVADSLPLDYQPNSDGSKTRK